jgi:hypothetical protein
MWDAAIKSAERNHFAKFEMKVILLLYVIGISSRLALKSDSAVGGDAAVTGD